MGYSMIEVQSIRHFSPDNLSSQYSRATTLGIRVRIRPYARLFFHGCHRMHIIQFPQHTFPLQRRKGRDEKLAVREHRE